MSVDESGQEGAISSLDYFRLGGLQRASTDPADLSILYEHAAMLENVLAIEHPNIAYELRDRLWLT